MITLSGAADSSVGRAREVNEDTFLLDLARRVFIVADGLGGHTAGEVASHMAVEKISAGLMTRARVRPLDPAAVLLASIREAHESIRDVSERYAGQSGMGTTAAAAWLPDPGGPLWVAHVGDSRVYLLRAGVLKRLTQDHTLYNAALRAGRLPEGMDTGFLKHTLSQALGPSEHIAPEIQSLDLLPGDRLLLCSDGLTNMLNEARIVELLGGPAGVEETCRQLIASANQAGGQDNITALVLQADLFRGSDNGSYSSHP